MQTDRDKKVIKCVKEFMRASEMRTLPDRQRWATAHALFRGVQEFDEFRVSYPWRNQLFIHQFAPMVRRMADKLANLIFEDDTFYGLTPMREGDQATEALTDVIKKQLDYYIAKMKLDSAFVDYCLAGGIQGLGVHRLVAEPEEYWEAEAVLENVRNSLYPKDTPAETDEILPPESEAEALAGVENVLNSLAGPTTTPRRVLKPKKKTRVSFRFEVLDPSMTYWEAGADHFNDSWWHAIRTKKRKYELYQHFKTGFFRRGALKEFREMKGGPVHSSSAPEGDPSTYDLSRKTLLTDNNNYAPEIELVEFYGHIIDPTTGEILQENRHVIIANGKLVLRNKPNPYYSQKSPVRGAIFSKVPFKATGAGVADGAVDTQRLTNEIVSTFVDNLQLAVYSPLGLDRSALEDPDELAEGVYPGQTLGLLKPGKEVLSPLGVGDVNVAPAVFQTLNYLDMVGERSSGVDTGEANPSSRARISAAEIGSNVARANESQFSLARELDNNFLTPFVEQLVQFILQFGLARDHLEEMKTMGVISEMEFNLVVDIPEIERYYQAKSCYKITVKGFRERLEKNEQLSRLVEFLSVLPQLPPQATESIDYAELLRQIIRAFGFDMDKLIVQNNPADHAREENRLLENDQMVSVMPDGNDAIHLPNHYDLLLRNPTAAAIAHVQQHIQQMMMRGEQPPPPPPEVGQMLGLTEQAQQMQAEEDAVMAGLMGMPVGGAPVQ